MTTATETTACTFEKSFDLPASRQRVFAALTERTQLESWFAEHMRIQPRVGGDYRFWGRYTPWVATESQADQSITAFDSPIRLAWRWTWRDTPCDIDLRLTDAGSRDACVLHVRMTASPSRIGFGDECAWIMSDFWRVSVGNLRAYLVDGKPALRPDYLAKGEGVDMSIFIAAPPSVVFDALTNPVKMDRWISVRAISTRIVGSDYSYGWTNKVGEDESPTGPTMLIDVVPNRLVEHDWHHKNEPITRVRWHLTEVPGGTMVRLTHKRRIVEPEFGGYVGGWTSFLLELRDFAGAITRGEESQWRSPAHTVTTVEGSVAR